MCVWHMQGPSPISSTHIDQLVTLLDSVILCTLEYDINR